VAKSARPGGRAGGDFALLLSVLLVFATWQAFTLLNWTTSLPGKIMVGVIAMLASILVIVAYHFGYSEYRSNGIRGPVIGNTTMTLGYLLRSISHSFAPRNTLLLHRLGWLPPG
jgi:uncharacterized membrane protein